jgi:hypothetical protein
MCLREAYDLVRVFPCDSVANKILILFVALTPGV